METLIAKLLDYLKGQSFQVAVVFAVVLILTWLLRNRSAHIRYLLWLLVAIKCLTPPLVIFSVPLLPAETIPVILPSQNSTIEHQQAPIIIEQPKSTETVTVIDKPQQALPVSIENLSPRDRKPPIINFLTAHLNFTLISVWAAGGAFYLLWAAIKAVRLQLWLKQNHRPVGPHLAGEIEELSRLWNPNKAFTVRLLDNISQPFVWGLWRGAIYLPSRIQSIQTDRQKAVVMHEMAHIVRLDAFVNLLQILIQGLFWFHPLVWLANRFIRQEREKCCDETAIARLNTQPKEYGSAIIETLVQEYHNTIPVPSLAVAGPIKNIEDRIKTIMQPGKRFFRRPSIVALLIIGALAAVIAPTTIALTQKNTPPNHTVTGTVTDAQTGAPIAGAEVFDDGYNDNKGRTTTGDDGKFELKTWNEEHFISAGAKGYESHKQLLKTFPFANNKNFNFQLKKLPSDAGNTSPAMAKSKLEFRVAPEFLIDQRNDAMVPLATLDGYAQDLQRNGPRAAIERNERYIWYKLSKTAKLGQVFSCKYNEDTYVLVDNDPKRVMLSDQTWALKKAYAAQRYDTPAVCLEFDQNGERLFSEMEGHVPYSWLAIIAEGEIISFIEQVDKKDGLFYARGMRENLTQEKVDDLVSIFQKYISADRPEQETGANAAKEQMKFTAALPGGVKVELLGICEDVSQNKWWRPDGTVFTPEKFVLKENGVCTASMPYRDRIFLAKITGPDGMNYGFGKILGSKGTLSLKIEDSSGNSIPDLFADKVHLDTSYELTEVTVRVTAGAWKTIATRTPGGGVSAQGTDNYGITFAGAIEKDGKIIVTASDDLVDMDHRIVAVDKEGKEHVGPQPWSSAGKTRLTTAEFKDLNLNQVKEFQFRVRPYQQVEFKNVSLKPGLKTDVKIETYKPQNKTGQEQSKAMAIFDNPKFKKRFFMTIVADKDNQISGDGRKTTFEELDAIMPKNPDPSHTVLEVAFEPGAFPDIRTQYAQNPVFQKAGQLVEKYHLECLSYVGEDHPESRREPLSIRMEDAFVMDKDIAVAMSALSLQEDKPLLTVDTVHFSSRDAQMSADMKMTVISHPKRQWEIKARLLDKDGGQLDSVVKYYQNSGVALGQALVSKDLLIFNFKKRDLSTIAKFEIELRQTQPASKQPAKETTPAPQMDEIADRLPVGWKLDYYNGDGGWRSGMARNVTELRIIPTPLNEYDESWKKDKISFEVYSLSGKRIGGFYFRDETVEDRMVLVPGKSLS